MMSNNWSDKITTVLKNSYSYADAMLYAVFTATSIVFIDKLAEAIDPLVSLLFMVSGASIWFNLINFRHLARLYTICCSNHRAYFLIALVISINWIASIYAPHYGDPFIYLAIYFIILSICGLLASYWQSKSNIYLISCAILFITCIMLGFFYKIDPDRNITIGFTLGIIGGISAYIYAFLSNKFIRKNGFTSSQLLAIRFLPLNLLLFFFLKFKHLSFNLHIHNIIFLIITTFISLIIPVYFYQQAIKNWQAIPKVLVLEVPAMVEIPVY